MRGIAPAPFETDGQRDATGAAAATYDPQSAPPVRHADSHFMSHSRRGSISVQSDPYAFHSLTSDAGSRAGDAYAVCHRSQGDGTVDRPGVVGPISDFYRAYETEDYEDHGTQRHAVHGYDSDGYAAYAENVDGSGGIV